MVLGLLFLVVVAVVVVVIAKKTATHAGQRPTGGHPVRRFFQYVLLFGLLVVAATGLAGLLGRAIAGEVLAAADEEELARFLAFTVVGLPLFAGVALWSRRTFSDDPAEARSLAWGCYVTIASLTSLLVAMTGLEQVLSWATGLTEYDGSALARFLVWGGVWGAHWWVDARVAPPASSRVHHLVGSLIGLVTAASGLAGLLTGALRVPLGLDGSPNAGRVIAEGGDPILQGLVTLLVGAPVWLVYWFLTTSKRPRDPFWLAYVLLAGVGGGLVTAIASASTLVYTVLVWLVGDPGSASAAEHFDGAPASAATAAVGALVWWYHQAVLAETGVETRTEVRRIYEYLMAGIGLLAAAGGLATVIVAIIEAVTGTGGVLVNDSTVNTLLAAATLLAVGGPVWWLFWRRIQRAAGRATLVEVESPTRRVYLFVLLGLGGVVTVVALLVGVFLLFEDVVEGTVDTETLRRMRVPIGLLVAAAGVAAYHWTVYRADREHVPAPVEVRGPRFVLLVGPADTEIAAEVAARTHGRVQAWARTDAEPARWSADDVMAVLGGTAAPEVVVLAEAGALRVVPVRRG